MRTDTKDLLHKHFDLFNEVMDASVDSKDVVSCPSCDFKLSYKNHSVSFETSVNKTIAHMLETH
jgi:hypothetical protein